MTIIVRPKSTQILGEAKTLVKTAKGLVKSC